MGLCGRSKHPGAGSQYDLWATIVGLCIGISSVVSGCARGVETLQGEDSEGDDSGASGSANAGTDPGGSSTSSGGNTGASGSANAGSGGKIMNTSGGTNTSGGSAGGGAGSTAGSGGKAGSSGSGGVSGTMGRGGASGSGGSGGKATGGSAGTAGSAGTTGSGGGGTACLQNWKGDKCDTCSTQTQSDKLGCVDVLDCYATNSCGPGTCDGNTQKCGANVIAKGTAGYPIAADVYNCLCK